MISNRLLMCAPKFFNVSYAINPWMRPEATQVDPVLAQKQWTELKETLQGSGARVEEINLEQEPTAHTLPDLVFTANSGLVIDKKVWLSNFRFPERQGETAIFGRWFKNAGYEVFGWNDKSNFEGTGDALHAGRGKLFCAYGPRTDYHVYDDIEDTLLEKENPHEIILVRLVTKKFYHLDTCFCPLNSETALWYPGAFDKESQEKIAGKIDLIEVKESDAGKFACNSVVVGRNVIMPAGGEAVASHLKTLGLTVHLVDVSEFIKAGGACRCLVCPI